MASAPSNATKLKPAAGVTVTARRTALDALAGRNASIAQQLFALTGRELVRIPDRIMLLIKSAQERVAAFLLEMAERASGSNIVELPMSRQDIADYLGLSLETVSRTFSALETAAGRTEISMIGCSWHPSVPSD
jgi:CRP/FNR family nitrogen fixation transcriptional regulator